VNAIKEHINLKTMISIVSAECTDIDFLTVPDTSATHLRQRLKELCDVEVTIVINDSAGRAWQNCTVDSKPLENMIGQMDIFSSLMEVTQIAIADELAAASCFLMGKADESIPLILIRGANFPVIEAGSQSPSRAREQDSFR